MLAVSLVAIAVALFALAGFVWFARPANSVNRWFAGYTLALAGWTVGIAGVLFGTHAEFWGRIAFSTISLFPACLLGFTRSYPALSPHPSSKTLYTLLSLGVGFAAVSLSTPLVISDIALTVDGISRKPGRLYSAFAVYELSVCILALAVFIQKFMKSTGMARAQLQYLGLGMAIQVIGPAITNLVLPFLTGRSTYGWAGPFFGVPFVSLIAHSVIRHRLMDLKVVIHRGLTVSLAMILSLLPVGLLLIFVGPSLTSHLRSDELAVLLVAVIVVTLLVPVTRDVANRVLDAYVYRNQADYRRTVHHASRFLTRVLNLRKLLTFLQSTITSVTRPEGVAVYVADGDVLARRDPEASHPGARFLAPKEAPASVMAALRRSRELIVADELARVADDGEARALHADLARMNWALVLPLLSEDTVVGAIVLGAKRSGDAYYPQDLDLLTTLANQAGIAIKNAQLYAEILLAKEYLQNIVGTIESGVVAIDESGHVTMFNRGAEHLTGMRAADIQERPAAALPACLAEALESALANGQALTQPEVELPGTDRTRPVICTTSPLRDNTGAALGAVAVFSDLTPLKTLEIERRRAERLAYFEVLASGIGHEIKNPLVSIKTFAQLIARRRDDAKFVDDFSRIVGREIGHIERLLERLNALSRPSDRPPLRLDLRVPIGEALETLQPTFDEKGVTARLRVGDRAAFVLGDEVQLKQLFMNLFINAHEATPPGGTLTIELTATDEHVVVTVDDTGPGIPAALVERIFEPFFSTRQRGSGLGLAICAGIAAGHHARLSASNQPDGGARFTLALPVAATVTAPASA